MSVIKRFYCTYIHMYMCAHTYCTYVHAPHTHAHVHTAHSDGIWGLSWRRSESLGQEFIITGSVDSLVKAWIWLDQNICTHVQEGTCTLGLRKLFTKTLYSLIPTQYSSSSILIIMKIRHLFCQMVASLRAPS